MPVELFVDTSAWYPTAVTNHPQHAQLSAALTAAIHRGNRIVTTNLVVAETHALLLHRTHRGAALRFVQAVRQAPTVLVTSDAALEAAAIANWLERFTDQDFSLADAVSFEVMQRRGIGDALSLDRHFRTAGYATIG